MPIFEYRCSKCDEVKEEFLKRVTDEPSLKCGFCGGKLVRLLSRSSFILKGNDWTPRFY